MNDIRNGGGYGEDWVNVIVDKGKGKKSLLMVKLGRGYLRMKKWVLYVDRENGKEEMMEGFIEWCMNKSKKEL